MTLFRFLWSAAACTVLFGDAGDNTVMRVIAGAVLSACALSEGMAIERDRS